MALFELRPFALVEAAPIARWAQSAEDAWQAAGTREPLTAADITRWTLETNYALTLRLDGDPVAYAEIVEDDVEGDAEIQHLLVAPDMRNRGVGREMLAHLCVFAAERLPYPDIWLRARRDHEPALRCARAAGFRAVEALSGPQYVWLKRAVADASLPVSQ